MTDFIKDYGEVIVTCIIAVMAWRALKEWKKQQKIAKAEEYVGLLWQLRKFGTNDLKQAVINDIVDDFHIKPANARESTFFLSTVDNLILIQSQLLLIYKIFPKIKKNIQQLNDDITFIMGKTYELQENIRDELLASEIDSNEKKFNALQQVEDYFDGNDIIKRISETHEEINNYLADYIVKGLK